MVDVDEGYDREYQVLTEQYTKEIKQLKNQISIYKLTNTKKNKL